MTEHQQFKVLLTKARLSRAQFAEKMGYGEAYRRFGLDFAEEGNY